MAHCSRPSHRTAGENAGTVLVSDDFDAPLPDGLRVELPLMTADAQLARYGTAVIDATK